MYKNLFEYFGLRQNPFHVSPDPQFYFSTPTHSAALGDLMTGVETRRGLFVLTGEAGTGKTIVLRHLLDWLEAKQLSSCYIFHSQLNPLELFESIFEDFGVQCHSRHKRDVIAALNHWLVQRRKMGDTPVLIIDEAQAISLRTLDRLNLLLSLEIGGSKLLQIILVGQPELESKLRSPELWQLQQRIISQCRLAPLTYDETSAYIKWRMENSGCTKTIFSEDSLKAVHLCSRGIPRVVNSVCEHALMAAFSEKSKEVTRGTIWRVAGDFDSNLFSSGPSEEETSQCFDSSFTEDQPNRLESKKVAVTKEPIEEIVDENTVQINWPSKRAANAANFMWPEAVLEPPTETAESRTVELPQPIATSKAMPANPVGAEWAKPRPIGPKELPVNWKRPGVLEGVVRYWHAVGQSFVSDWKRFLQEHMQERRISRSSSSDD
jgi:general secretion pathway protein A